MCTRGGPETARSSPQRHVASSASTTSGVRPRAGTELIRHCNAARRNPASRTARSAVAPAPAAPVPRPRRRLGRRRGVAVHFMALLHLHCAAGAEPSARPSTQSKLRSVNRGLQANAPTASPPSRTPPGPPPRWQLASRAATVTSELHGPVSTYLSSLSFALCVLSSFRSPRFVRSLRRVLPLFFQLSLESAVTQWTLSQGVARSKRISGNSQGCCLSNLKLSDFGPGSPGLCAPSIMYAYSTTPHIFMFCSNLF